MGFELPERPRFLETALQGLAFWIGHRHSLFRTYPLPEGAVVAEACNLIQANLPDRLELLPECQYKTLVSPNSTIEGLQDRARADLVILTRNSPGANLRGAADAFERVQFVIEVKRGTASPASINEDLRRLYRFLTSIEKPARAFLIVVSESAAPRRFVSKGKSLRGTFSIPASDGCFHVRRTVKAAASFSNKSSAHYVCLIEVFEARPRKLPEV